MPSSPKCNLVPHVSSSFVALSTMASVLENDGGAIDVAKYPRRRGKSWLREENVGVVIAVCTLPDSAIDGANISLQHMKRRSTPVL
jgi:hypothetical protein